MLDAATIARKSKEMEVVLREKKCFNCVLCVDDIKHKIGDSQVATISTLNDQLVQKTCKINELEEANRQSNHLIS